MGLMETEGERNERSIKKRKVGESRIGDKRRGVKREKMRGMKGDKKAAKGRGVKQ